ncbi:MAG: DUF4230 domain-containing protein [Prevotella sp.]|nr:DUF4230 domain-containing protein [Prevotella sp.]MBO7538564.1 DUF4230 domain-containing protein [Prevotella sp.]
MRKTIENIRSITIAAAVIVVVLLAVWLYRALEDARLEIGADDSIGLTPTQIESIKAVGEWEFLSVSTEELVDTTRKRLFSDDQLVRIYYGTLRLGVNMKQVEPGWIQQRNDTLFLTLPKVGLLDRDFIDEARTKSFFESGTWKAEDREALYKRAYRKMIAHCLTPTNLSTAEDNARESFRKLLRSMGYQKVDIKFAK